MLRNCVVCGIQFESRYGTLTCSPECKKTHFRKNQSNWSLANKDKVKATRKKVMDKRRESGKALEYRNKRRSSKAGYIDRFIERATLVCPETDLTREYLFKLMEDDKCCITGMPFAYSNEYNCFHNPKAPSIDRIDSKQGYFKGNIQVMLSCLNRFKNDLPNEDFLVLWNALKEAK